MARVLQVCCDVKFNPTRRHRKFAMRRELLKICAHLVECQSVIKYLPEKIAEMGIKKTGAQIIQERRRKMSNMHVDIYCI